MRPPPRPLGEVVVGERLAGRLPVDVPAVALAVRLDIGGSVAISPGHAPSPWRAGARVRCTVVEVVGQRPAAFDVEVVE